MAHQCSDSQTSYWLARFTSEHSFKDAPCRSDLEFSFWLQPLSFSQLQYSSPSLLRRNLDSASCSKRILRICPLGPFSMASTWLKFFFAQLPPCYSCPQPLEFRNTQSYWEYGHEQQQALHPCASLILISHSALRACSRGLVWSFPCTDWKRLKSSRSSSSGSLPLWVNAA